MRMEDFATGLNSQVTADPIWFFRLLIGELNTYEISDRDGANYEKYYDIEHRTERWKKDGVNFTEYYALLTETLDYVLEKSNTNTDYRRSWGVNPKEGWGVYVFKAVDRNAVYHWQLDLASSSEDVTRQLNTHQLNSLSGKGCFQDISAVVRQRLEELATAINAVVTGA
jgi:hypothetical protein